MKRLFLVLLQAAVIIGCGICVGLLIFRWMATPAAPSRFAPDRGGNLLHMDDHAATRAARTRRRA